MKNKIDIFKAGLSLIVGIGVGAIIGNAVKITTPSDVKMITKICIAIGGAALSGLVGDAASNYAEDQIDKVVDIVKNTLVNDEQLSEIEEVKEET